MVHPLQERSDQSLVRSAGKYGVVLPLFHILLYRRTVPNVRTSHQHSARSMAKVIMEDEGSIPTRTQQHYLYFGEDAIPVLNTYFGGNVA